MRDKFIITALLILVSIPVYGFSKKMYSNYDREAVSSFLFGLFNEQLMNSDGAKKYYERSYERSKSDYVRYNLAIEYILANQSEEGYKILNEMYENGFKLGRMGIYLYLNEAKKDKSYNSSEILDRIIKELYESKEINTASMVLNQKITDKIFSFKSNDEFEEFLSGILNNEFSMTYKIYFSTIAIQFYSKSNRNIEKMQEIIDQLETEYSELPYLFYRFVFDEYIYLEDFEKADVILQKMNRYTYGEAKYYSDTAEYYSEKGDFNKARNKLLDGMKEFPESSLKLQMAGNYLKINDYDKAELIYENVLNEIPDNNYLYQMIANEYSKSGNIEESFILYEKALNKFPDDPELLNNYAYVLAENSKDLEKALKYIEKALKDRADSITFLDTKAWILFKMGNLVESEMIMDRIFLDENAFYHSSSEELFDHLKAIKEALNKSEELYNISINKTAIMLSEILSKSNYILQNGF